MRSPAHTALADGMRCKAAAQALMMKSLSESLNAGWPSLLFRRGGIGLLTHGDQAAGIEIGREIEVRNRLLCLHQPRGDGAAHGIERNFLVGDALVERLDLRGARSGCLRRSCMRRGRFHVVRDNAAMRAGS